MPRHGHHQGIRLVSRRAGSAPDFQVPAKSLNQLRNRLLLHHFPLIRVPVELRHINRDVIDELFELPLIRPQAHYILVVPLYPVLGNQIVDTALHLAFLVTVQVDSGHHQYFSLEILKIKYHGSFRPVIIGHHPPPAQKSPHQCPRGLRPGWPLRPRIRPWP